MTKRCLLYLLLLVCAALASGCGTSSPPPSPPTTPDPSAGGGGGSASDPAVKQAIENCKKSVESQPGVSPDVKSDLLEICEEAAKGDEQDVRKATQKVCEKLIEENVPAGPAREQAKQSCAQSAQGP